jgi:hypothetical protein
MRKIAVTTLDEVVSCRLSVVSNPPENDEPGAGRQLSAASKTTASSDLQLTTDNRQLTTTKAIKDLPKEVGAMLVSVGVLGFVLPGVMGTPAIIAGGLVLWPKTFGKVETWFERRYPSLYRRGMRQVGRYLDDLDRRFPT